MAQIKQVVSNLSLRKSIVMSIVCFFVVATVVSAMLTSGCRRISGKITASYPQSGETYYLTNELGEQLGDGVRIIAENREYSKRDERLLKALAIIETLAVPLVFATCMLMAVFVFYKIKLKEPLEILDQASDRIANHDLAFDIDYPSQDEMGRLCRSFDTMRLSLLQNNKLMDKQMEQRKRLNAAFAHDLRTPLTVLKGYSEILQLKSDSPTKETALTMAKHINRLERYVESMSRLQRMEDITPDYKQTNLSELVASTREMLVIIFEASDKHFVLHHQVTSDTAMLDRELFLQVLENLIANAMRYAVEKVVVRLFETSEYIGIVVVDDGVGFTAESLEKATEPYYTGSDRTSEHFGLGLYICQLLCAHHGGDLAICNTDSGAKITASFRKATNES